MTSTLHVFINRRMAALLALGFSSGLPLALTADTLQAWMKDAKVDLGKIGLIGLVGLPSAIKFLWAPFMDRFTIPLLGRRRGWLLVTQLALMATLAAMSFARPERSLLTVAGVALLIAFFSASQDIVVDAYRVDLLEPDERAAGAAISITGYRVAMIVSAAGALYLSGRFNIPWPTIYLMMAAAMSIGVIATIFAPEPSHAVEPPHSLFESVVNPIREFIGRPQGLFMLAFVIIFKLPDVLAGAMTVPFMLDIGIAKTDIATVRQALGIAITIIGALAGGAIVPRMGLMRSMWLFGILQAASNVGFLVMAQAGPSYKLLVAVIAIENFCGGLTAAGFVAFLMSQCNPKFSATQYAILTSLMALTRVLLGSPTGYLVTHTGWSGFFMITILSAIPGMMLLPFLKPRPQDEDEITRGFAVVVPE